MSRVASHTRATVREAGIDVAARVPGSCCAPGAPALARPLQRHGNNDAWHDGPLRKLNFQLWNAAYLAAASRLSVVNVVASMSALPAHLRRPPWTESVRSDAPITTGHAALRTA